MSEALLSSQPVYEPTCRDCCRFVNSWCKLKGTRQIGQKHQVIANCRNHERVRKIRIQVPLTIEIDLNEVSDWYGESITSIPELETVEGFSIYSIVAKRIESKDPDYRLIEFGYPKEVQV